LYARWKNYADNGTGGNKELEKIKKEKGMEAYMRSQETSLTKKKRRSAHPSSRV
jgi:hypothetical protein